MRKTLQWQLKVITQAINAAATAAADTKNGKKLEEKTKSNRTKKKVHVIYLSSIGWQ